MKCLAASLALFALFTASAAARADTIFDVNGTFLDGATLSGTLNYNGTTFNAGDVFIRKGAQAVEFTSGAIAQVMGQSVTAIFAEASVPLGTVYLDLFLNTPSLTNFTGASLCSLQSPCAGAFNTSNFNLDHIYALADPLASGSITPLVPTPEPSSLALMGTGLAGMAGYMRRRMRHA